MKNQKKGYGQYHRCYEKKVKCIYALYLFVVFLGGTIGFFLYKDVHVTELIVGVGFLLCVLLKLLQKTEDTYISHIIEDLSEVLEQLMSLEDMDVFPKNEDTLVSKLQNQILRAVHILKKQGEQERKEHENIKHLVSDLSHQLKTPLANIKMYTDFLKKEDMNELQKADAVHALEVSVERLLFLSENMIKVSRLESGLITLSMVDASINDTILKAIKDAFGLAKKKQARLAYDENFTGKIKHDSSWTAEAIYNLIDNGIKYGKEENVITIGVRELGTMIEISVEDENQPIEPSEYNSIFDRFYRGKNSANQEGMGIGLFLARQILEMQGGYLVVKPGKAGNRFVIGLRK